VAAVYAKRCINMSCVGDSWVRTDTVATAGREGDAGHCLLPLERRTLAARHAV
jgi:hypothetical protein